MRQLALTPSCWVVGMLCALPAGVWAGGPPWPDLPEPPRSTVEWVAHDVRVNGLRTRILKFDSELPVADIVDFYQRRWGGVNSQAARPLHFAGWKGVSSLVGDFQFTVQAKPAKPQGSTGLISVANVVDARAATLPAGWPAFGDTRVLQVTESDDGPRHSVLVHQSSRASFSINVDRWRRAWQQRGYALTREVEVPAERAAGRQWMAFFDRSGDSADVTVAELEARAGVVVTVNHVSALLP